MKMDSASQVGETALRIARNGARAFIEQNPTLNFIFTPDKRPADVDALLYRRDSHTLLAAVEAKTRYFTLDRLDEYDGLVMMDYSKLVRGSNLAQSLQCNFANLVVLPRSKIILYQTLIDHNGTYTADIEVKPAEVRATINTDETIIKDMAYINMTESKRYELKKPYEKTEEYISDNSAGPNTD
jgi:hypothetical protein